MNIKVVLIGSKWFVAAHSQLDIAIVLEISKSVINILLSAILLKILMICLEN